MQLVDLTLCMLGNLTCNFLAADFFFHKKFFQGYHQSVKQFDILSGLILAETVCKGYLQTMLVSKELKWPWLSER